jgi:hypothetical protein
VRHAIVQPFAAQTVRENIAVASVEYGFTLKYDVSLATKDFYRIVEDTRKII